MTSGMNLATTGLPIALALIMFGLGLTLRGEDFGRVLKYPRAILVGLFTQTFVLTAVAFALAVWFKLPAELAIGLMILAASPGGVTANVFSHLSHGDVALNLTLTAVNSLLSALTLPLIVNASIAYFNGTDGSIGLQFGKVLEVFAIVLVPVFLGMLVRKSKSQFADKLDKPIRIFSMLVLLSIVVASVSKEWNTLSTYFAQIGSVVLTFNLLSMALGYAMAKAFRLDQKQSTAISMEIGIHNGTLAIFIAMSLLQNYTMAVPAALYSVLMFFTATGAAFWFKTQNKVPFDSRKTFSPSHIIQQKGPRNERNHNQIQGNQKDL